MLDLILEACLADRPEICATRLLPGPCTEAEAEARARGWAEARGLSVTAARCGRGEALAVEEVAPGVFVHNGAQALADSGNRGDIATIGFVVGEESVAVIDAGGSRAIGEALYAAVRETTDLPIGWLVITHMHPDHSLGASVFSEAGAATLAHAKLPAALEARTETYLDTLVREAGPEAALGTEVVLPSETVPERRSLDLGGRELLLEAHPTAHTDNDLTVFDTATGTLWTGDLVFDGHLPTVDGSVLGWLDVLEQLAGREAERAVPGHGGPVLDWPEGAAPTHDYLARLVEETRAAVARGDSLSDAATTVGQDLAGDWALFDVFHPRNVTATFRELEWE